VDQGVDVVVVRTPFEGFTVRVERAGVRAESERLELARWAAKELRFGIEMGEPAVVRAARELVALLDGEGFGFGRDSVPLDDGLGGRASGFGVGVSVATAFGGIAGRLEDELLAGRLVVERERLVPLSDRRDPFELELPPLPPPRRESGTRTFEVRFVDEVGKAISGIDAEFTADGAQTRATNAAGIALLDGVQASSASVAILDPEALAKVLDPRWDKFRPGAPPKESNLQEVVFRGNELGPFSLKAELPNTVVIKPPLGKLFVELFDKSGRVRHANRTYQITGPQAFEGTTDEDGRLLHEDVFPGDYTLSISIESFTGDPDASTDTVTTPLVVLEPTAGSPQVRGVGAVPRSVLARLHMFFNTNKTFLLPTTLPSILRLRRLYLENAPCDLLVVGHADTRGTDAYNDKLSLDRAKATIAYLQDDVETWFEFYSDPEPKRRWGKVEDRLMIRSLPDFRTKGSDEDPVSWFQRTRSLKVDGVAGTDTRHALISEYMSLDGTSLAEFEGQVSALAHGCGEHFPLDDTGDQLDAAPADEKRDPIDRRVELFFFDREFGVTPKPQAESSKAKSLEYPTWRRRVTRVVDLHPDDPEAAKVHFVELADAHFRTNSAVVLPEGEDPDQSGEHQALTSMGLIAVALRFNQLRPGRKLLVAGHTDTTADPAFNQKLSEERARTTLALLEGGDARRDDFAALCDGRHTVADIKQILSWASRALGFACNPGRIDDDASTLSKPVTGFQNSYNDRRGEIAPTRVALDPDGKFGPLAWKATFDCYEFALRSELGKDASGLAELRLKLVFADAARKSLGFSEHFPIEELGVDEFRSQTNRRVEILFFEPGEEPDLSTAASEPELSELYLPGGYVHTPLSNDDLQVGEIHMQLLDETTLEPLKGSAFQVEGEDLSFAGVTDGDGKLRQADVPLGTYELKVDGRAETAQVVVLTHSADEPQIRLMPATIDRPFEFRLHDGARKPLANAQCKLTLGESVLAQQADGDGLATFKLPPVCPPSVLVEWTDGTTQFSQEVFLDCNEGDPDSLAPCRLENLGYPAFADLELAVAMFQMDYQLSPVEQMGPNEEMPQRVLDELKAIWEDRSCDARLPGAA
jgi:outer membrane protein OmpA-like peptidoglycan-associated protein